MSTLRFGSLFAGYGGLEMGVQSALGGETMWHAEIDPGACKILNHHWPTVPNLGDITAVDWSTVEPVDILTGGFPCQDVSHAGKRRGLKPGTRSGLWAHMAYAIDQLRPALVVAENVRGLLSAEASGDLEPCAWCVGDGTGSPLRALGAVLGDLADIGYDAQWYGLRAADVGAPHGRFRVFVFAWPATDADGFGWAGLADADRAAADANGAGLERGERCSQAHSGPTVANPEPTPNTPRDGWDERWPEPARQLGRPHAPQRGGTPIPDACGERHGRGQDGRSLGRVDGEDASQTREWERSRAITGNRSATDWGIYEPAIRRWEYVLGRSAPAPTEPGKNGQPRLSPIFVEYLMGLPAGHVTDVPGLTRNAQLKALGNGVVPQQAAAAVRMWAAAHTVEVAA